MQSEESLLVVCKKNSGSELSVLQQCSTHRPSTISTMLKWSLMVLVLFTSVASAQAVQTINSETQLASVLCRNPQAEARNELLLDKHSQLVNVTLWNGLLDCAASGPRQGSGPKSVEIYKLALHVGDPHRVKVVLYP